MAISDIQGQIRECELQQRLNAEKLNWLHQEKIRLESMAIKSHVERKRKKSA